MGIGPMETQLQQLAGEPDEPLVLRLEDLLPDKAGEVVLSAEIAPVNIVAGSPLADAGFAESHVTEAGVDVTGLSYCSFENGVTLYYPSEIPLIVSLDLG